MKRFDETWWFESLFLLAMCGIGFMLWQWLVHPYINPAIDHTLYMELARSILQGTGFSVLHLGQPTVDVLHPPFYPLILAGIGALTGKEHLSQWILPFKTLSMGLYLLSIVLVYAFSNRNLRKPYPYLVCLVYALCPLTLSAATSISPELLYLDFALMGLLSIDKFFVGRGENLTRVQLLWCCVWILLAVFTKNIGFSLMLAFVLMCGHCLGLRRAAIIGGILLALLTPWFLREAYYRNVENVPVVDTGVVVQKNLDPFESGKAPTEAIISNARNTVFDLSQVMFGALHPTEWTHTLTEKTPLETVTAPLEDNQLLQWVLSTLVVFGLIFAVRTHTSIGSVYLVIYGSLCLFFPIEKPAHYLLPVLPLVVFYIFMGLMRFGDWMAQVKIPVSLVTVPLMALLLLINCTFGLMAMSQSVSQLTAYYRPAEKTEAPRGYLSALKWIRRNTPHEARMVSARPSAAYVFTERQTTSLTARDGARNNDPLLTQLLHRDYVLEESTNRWARRVLSPIIQANPQFFQLVYDDPTGQVRIWQVKSSH